MEPRERRSSGADARWRVTIVYVEPTYARHRGIPVAEYRRSYEVLAHTAEDAIAAGRRLFREAAARATVGWPRIIVRALAASLDA